MKKNIINLHKCRYGTFSIGNNIGSRRLNGNNNLGMRRLYSTQHSVCHIGGFTYIDYELPANSFSMSVKQLIADFEWAGLNSPRSDQFIELYIMNKLLDSFLEFIIYYKLKELLQEYIEKGEDDNILILKRADLMPKLIGDFKNVAQFYIAHDSTDLSYEDIRIRLLTIESEFPSRVSWLILSEMSSML
jgi:hypothetical protein